MLLREQFRVGRVELQQLLNILELRLRVLDVFIDTLLREGMKKAPAGASAYNRFSYERSHIYRTILNDCFRNFIPNTFHMINLDFHFFSIMVPKCVYI